MLQDITLSTIASWVAALAAVGALFWSVYTQNIMQKNEAKRATIEAFNKLQNEVLDKLVKVDIENAEIIAEARDDNEECRQAYNDYKALIARLEHFSVGIEQGAYDLEVVDKLAGEHLVYLLPKIEPIIDAANEHARTDKYYQSYVELVRQLEERHRK